MVISLLLILLINLSFMCKCAYNSILEVFSNKVEKNLERNDEILWKTGAYQSMLF